MSRKLAFLQKYPLIKLKIYKGKNMQTVLNQDELQYVVLEGLKARGYNITNILNLDVTKTRGDSPQASLIIESDPFFYPPEKEEVPEPIYTVVNTKPTVKEEPKPISKIVEKEVEVDKVLDIVEVNKEVKEEINNSNKEDSLNNDDDPENVNVYISEVAGNDVEEESNDVDVNLEIEPEEDEKLEGEDDDFEVNQLTGLEDDLANEVEEVVEPTVIEDEDEDPFAEITNEPEVTEVVEPVEDTKPIKKEEPKVDPNATTTCIEGLEDEDLFADMEPVEVVDTVANTKPEVEEEDIFGSDDEEDDDDLYDLTETPEFDAKSDEDEDEDEDNPFGF